LASGRWSTARSRSSGARRSSCPPAPSIRRPTCCAPAIGPVGHPRRNGHPPSFAALPGVGQRLMDHPSIALSSFVRRGARMNEHTRRQIHVGLRYSSNLPGIPKGDMFVAVATKSAWQRRGEQIASKITFRQQDLFGDPARSSSPRVTTAPNRSSSFNLLSTSATSTGSLAGFRKAAGLADERTAQGRPTTPSPPPTPTACALAAQRRGS